MSRSRRTIVIAAAAVVIAAGIAAYGIYTARVKPFRTIVLEVDGASVRMPYFLKRLAMSNETVVSML